MANTILSASFGYVDIAILVLLGLFLIVGLLRGFSKSMKGIFLSITIILVSLFLLGVTFAPISKSPLVDKLDNAIGASSSGWGASFTDPVFHTPDGLRILHDGEQVKIDSIDGIKGKIANWCANKFFSEDGKSVAESIVNNITSLIVSIILFILYCIAFSIIFAVLRRLTAGLHHSDSTAIKTVDRMMGGVFATGLGFVFVLVILAIFSALQNKIPSVIEYIQNSTIGKFFYDVNWIGKMFEKIFVG